MRNDHASPKHLHGREVKHASRESDDPMAHAAVMLELRESFGIEMGHHHFMGSRDNDRVEGEAMWFVILGECKRLTRLIAGIVGLVQHQMFDGILSISVGNSVRILKDTQHHLDFNTWTGVRRNDEDVTRFLSRGFHRSLMLVDPIGHQRSEKGSCHRVTRLADGCRGARRSRETVSMLLESRP